MLLINTRQTVVAELSSLILLQRYLFSCWVSMWCNRTWAGKVSTKAAASGDAPGDRRPRLGMLPVNKEYLFLLFGVSSAHLPLRASASAAVDPVGKFNVFEAASDLLIVGANQLS